MKTLFLELPHSRKGNKGALKLGFDGNLSPIPNVSCLLVGLQGWLEETEGGVQHGWSCGSGRHT